MKFTTTQKDRILITGSEGIVGRYLAQDLAKEFKIFCLDLKPKRGSKTFRADIYNYREIVYVFRRLPPLLSIVHLAGDPRQDASWDSVLRNNIIGTKNVYEAAREFSVPKVIFASSNHVTGGYEGIPPRLHLKHNPKKIHVDDPIRPDSYYGVSKAFGESIARYYYEIHGVQSICLRIGSVLSDDDPTHNPRFGRTWLSRRDLHSLVRAAIRTPVEFGVYYGVSNNKGKFWDITDAMKDLGYKPKDDASKR